MKIAIIGGGFCGLICAYSLQKKGHSVFLFEKENTYGGLAGSFLFKDWFWPLEKYYHHFFPSDKEIISLANELGLKNLIFFQKPKTSIFLKGKTFPFDNPFDILRFPLLSPLDKIRLGITTVFLKLNPFWQPMEKITAVEFIKKTMGQNVYQLIWHPLLKGKFGNEFEKISAAWFWTRINKRSRSLGYIKGGFSCFVKELTKQTCQKGTKLLTGESVSNIKMKDRQFQLFSNGRCFPEKFDQVVATVPPEIFQDMTLGLTRENPGRQNLGAIGSLLLVFELNQSFLTDKTYWLNINDLNFPFVAVVEHTNFIDKKNYNNHHLLYVGGYYPQNHRYFKMKKEDILKEFLPYLKKINPNFKFQISNFKLFSNLYAQPIIGLNYSQNIPKFKTSIPGLFWTSLHHVYPYDRGVNYAIKLGREIADEIDKKTEK